MKHATAETLAALAPLLRELRQCEPLVERSPGSFYFKSKAFLHFHVDPGGIYADVKLDGTSFERRRVTTRKEQEALMKQVRQIVSGAVE